MLDRAAQRLLQPFLQRTASGLHGLGLHADQVTMAAFALGLLAAGSIAMKQYHLGLTLILLSRLGDGLDGELARLTTPTDRGGFLDIALDFLFYALIPLAFAVADASRNALPAAVLLAAFVGTGSSFLAFAVLAAKRGLHSTAYPDKAFYFLGGLTEATETLACFVAMCLWPAWFGVLAYGFAALCGVTIATRIAWGWRALAP